MSKRERGQVGILNVGAGDTKLSFDPSDPAEVKRASAIVVDMIRRGYAVLVEVGSDAKGPLYRRALDFDPETAEYIIAGDPGVEQEGPTTHVKPSAAPPRRTRGRKGSQTERVPAAATSAVAVARVAGG
jgi:hypothetical protein